MYSEENALQEKQTSLAVTEQKSAGREGAMTEKGFKEKYGKVYKVSIVLAPDDDTEVKKSYIFIRPTTGSLNRYISEMSGNMRRASNQFLMDNVTEEYKDGLEGDLEEYPALCISLTEKLLTLLGLSKTSNLTRL